MTPERYARVCELFDQARPLDAGQRETFLNRSCGSDPSLRAEVMQMLLSDQSEAGADFLAGPAALWVGALLSEADTRDTGAHPETGFNVGADKSPADRSAVAVELPSVPGYQLLGELGRGGMGVVYKARHEKLDRLVALKMILAGAHAGSQELDRFLVEAQAVARLQHPNIVQIHEIGEHAGRPYFSLEFVDGGSLDKKLAGAAQPARPAAALVEALARAVHAAHQKGIIHRDLKPANILLASGGVVSGESCQEGTSPATTHHSPLTTQQPKITDFGLAKQLDSDSGHTRTGAVMGTPSYMAPEQAAGRTREIGPWSDVYALGAILYEMLTGRPPFRGESVVQTLEQVRSQDPEPPSRLQPKLHRDLETICLKALAKEPAQRYESALALAEDLQRFGAGEAILARREGLARKIGRKVRRSPLAFAAAAMIVVALVVLGYFVPRAYHDRQVAAASRKVNEGLDRSDWTAEHFNAVQSMIGELAELAPAEAATARQQLRQKLVASIQRLSEEAADHPRVESTLSLLASLDSAEAERLRKELRGRAFLWRPVFKLEAPFNERERVFALKLPQASPLPSSEWDRKRAFLLAASQLGLIAGSVGRPMGPLTALRPVAAERNPADVLCLPVMLEQAPARPILTQLPCQGNVELNAVFQQPSWMSCTSVGLVLYGNQEKGGALKGYTFTLDRPRHLPPELTSERPRVSPARATFEDLDRCEDYLSLQIRRNGEVLREQLIPAAAVFASSRARADRALHLMARREGERLLFQVNDLPVLEARDLAPLSAYSGTFGLLWPAAARVERFRGDRQNLPVAPNPLEQGDDLYARGRYDQALAYFRDAAAKARLPEVQVEARYKEALCCLAYNRPQEALPVFETLSALPLAGRKTDRWKFLADCQLLGHYFRSNQRDKAVALIDQLPARAEFNLGQLALDVPNDLREELLTHVSRGGDWVLRNPDELVRQNEVSVRLHDCLTTDPKRLCVSRTLLIKAYRLAGRDKDALQLAQAIFREYGYHHWTLEEFGWLERNLGEPAKAKPILQKCLQDKRFVHSGGSIVDESQAQSLLIEWARIHAAMNDWKTAAQSLERYLEWHDKGRVKDYHHYSAACLLQGFIILQAGGTEEEAVKAWRNGVFKHWRKKSDLESTRIPSNTGHYHNWILSALANDLDDADLDQIMTAVGSMAGKEVPTEKGGLARTVVSAAALRGAWRSPRGREWARKIALRDLTYFEYNRVPIYLMVGELAREQVMPPGPLTKDADELLWQFGKDGCAAALNGKLNLPVQAPIALLVLKGTPGFPGLGWKELSATLSPPLRGQIAYLFGQRYLRLKKPAEAAKFFQAALDEAPADSLLKRLAQKELEQPKKP